MSIILVTGCNGQLGYELQMLSDVMENSDHFLFLDKSQLDITDKSAIEKIFAENKIISVVNAAAYTAVDLAEKEKDLCHKVNVDGARNLAEVSADHKVKFIHVSTDFVFDGSKSTPYKEDDAKNPLGVYGSTKSQGEDEVLKAYPNSLIIRTSWVYSSYGKNFFTTILRLGQEKEEIKVVADQIGTPTWARDLAWFVYEALGTNASGIYHFTNEGVASWYDFAHTIVDAMGLDCNVLPITTEQYPTAAKRPSYSVLNKEKTRKEFGFENNHWRDAVLALAAELMDGMDEGEEEE
ncbi:dTDP-4-dehydrorhamnose reductase [Leptospira sp. GIMC2001]|uniref:dTDP-4-dehydrorhamnose reductase n=1 Tax=Leptospira sp. GIMC2001 TaxID=1513297 RepID=UPI00234A71E0|nr:dTDP-4-dehydrorhamnose reductase [Leptospira sp. GIMC2001]WCL51185.1 dTDP-4-dehydrorhamnose reductase [Leptospira sp. GIMC2001]